MLDSCKIYHFDSLLHKGTRWPILNIFTDAQGTDFQMNMDHVVRIVPDLNNKDQQQLVLIDDRVIIDKK